MSKDYKKYLQFLASEYNILYIGHRANQICDDIATYFATSSNIDINNEMLEKITSTLSKRHTNIVVIDVEDNNEIVKKFYEAIRLFDSNILIVLMFDPKEYRKLFEIVPFVDATVSYPVDKSLFYKRLFGILSIPYTIKSIGRRDLVLKQNNATESSSIDDFFDIYEGSSLFISDELLSMSKDLRSGNLSHDFFIHIADKINEVSDIFSKNKEMDSVSYVFKELSVYLKELDLEAIEPSNLKAFDYLCDILDDVSVYLLDMFVDRIFKDVYIFQDSLKNNIEFMKNILAGKNKDGGELIFFND